MFPLLALLFIAQPSDHGLLTVRSEPAGIAIYLDGDLLGTTPIERLPVNAGTYTVTIVSSDSLEELYWQARNGRLGQRLAALWTLARIDAGTAQVEIKAGHETAVFISSRTMAAAASRAKLLSCAGVTGLLGLGVLLGVLIGTALN
ncbi:MAG: PEGA domain-containing protein [candidate division WOR-3 bacterium]